MLSLEFHREIRNKQGCVVQFLPADWHYTYPILVTRHLPTSPDDNGWWNFRPYNNAEMGAIFRRNYDNGYELQFAHSYDELINKIEQVTWEWSILQH